MNRAAIYARYSSDLQTDRSIEDQFGLCRSFAAREGLAIVRTFDDRARSGASIMGRDGLMALMDAARDRLFDVVVVEALDRISRDQEDLAGIYKRLSFLGIEIRAVHDGRADAVQIGIRGLVGALYLQDLAHKIRRGMTGRVAEGASPGGKAYGYEPVPGEAGSLRIVEHEADVVRRIFQLYRDGHSPRDIAGRLNVEGVPAPRGSYWQASTINGSKQRLNGILQNPLYRGRLTWNRIHMIKDPDTGRRISRLNPKSEWKTVEVPHLRIVDEEAFDDVAAVKAASPDHRKSIKAKRLLSGLLRCGACGAGMSIQGKMGRVTRIVCTRAKESRTCDNHRPYTLDDIEAAVLVGLKTKILTPKAVEYLIWTYNNKEKARHASSGAARAKMENRLASLEREFQRATDLAIKGILSDDEARSRLSALRSEKAEIADAIAAMPENPVVVSFMPAAVAEYRALVERLDVALRDGSPDAAAVSADIRKMVKTVTVHPTGSGLPPEIEISGFLSNFVKEAAPDRIRIRGGAVVAGEGLEPPTPGL